MINLTALRRSILRMSHAGQAGHIPSGFSIVEILAALYGGILQDGDHFILSKGHGCLALYAVLAETGVIPADELHHFAKAGGVLGGHPGPHTPGVEFAAGSLGHGLAFGVGLALGLRIQRKTGRVFVLVGDGECQEGAVWEAAALASDLELPIWCIVDYNRTHNVRLYNIFEAYGWDTVRANGHNVDELSEYLRVKIEFPTALIADTEKGHGSHTLVDEQNAWHHRAPMDSELEKLLEEVG